MRSSRTWPAACAVLLCLMAAGSALSAVGPAPPATSGARTPGPGVLTMTPGAGTTSPYAVQWERAPRAAGPFRAIRGATSATYRPAPTDGGAYLRVCLSDAAVRRCSRVTPQVPPATRGKPRVVGVAKVGRALTVRMPRFQGAQRYQHMWQVRAAKGAPWRAAAGMTRTRARHVVIGRDKGMQFRVRVRAGNAGGWSAWYASIDDPPAPAPGAQVRLIVGDDGRLTVDVGTWVGSATFTYDIRWELAEAPEGPFGPADGVGGESFVPTDDQIGMWVRAAVRARNAEGASTVALVSDPVQIPGAAPEPVVDPAVDGRAAVGRTLQSRSSWRRARGALVREWLRCDAAGESCVSTGRVDVDYPLSAEDAFLTVRVREAATNRIGRTVRVSPASAQVAARPRNDVLPQVRSAPLLGTAVSADPGRWSTLDDPTVTYRWERRNASGSRAVTWEQIAGATDAQYVPQRSDVGSALRVSVTAGNAEGVTTATSGESAVVRDVTPPAVMSFASMEPSPSRAETIIYRIVFDEAIDDLAGNDLENAGTASGCVFAVAGAGDTYDVTASSCAQTGTLRPRLRAGAVVDASGNPGPDALAQTTITLDRIAPGVSRFDTSAQDPSNATTITYALVFDEPVAGVGAADITNDGSATGCQFAVTRPEGDVRDAYVVTVTGCSPSGTLVPRLVQGSAQDDAGNDGPAAPQVGASLALDRIAPTITEFATDEPAFSAADPVTYVLTFSEPVSDLAPEDITNAGDALGCTFEVAPGANAATYTITARTCAVTGELRPQLRAGAVRDAASNAGPTEVEDGAAITLDRVAPTVTRLDTDAPALTNDPGPITYALAFDEPVSGLSDDDISNAGTADDCAFAVQPGADATQYTILVSSCAASGTLAPQVADGAVADRALNAGPASAIAGEAITLDRIAPEVATFVTSEASPTRAMPVVYDLVFDEPVTGLGASDLRNAGTASGCQFDVAVGADARTYVVTVRECGATGDLEPELMSGSVVDLAANAGPDVSAAGEALTLDRVAPTVASLTTAEASPTNAGAITYALVFSEPVSGVESGDVVNGAADPALGCRFAVAPGVDAATYVVSVDQCGNSGGLAPRVASGAVSDAAGNIGPASSYDGEAIVIDRVAPGVARLDTTEASPSNATTIVYDLVFDEPVDGVSDVDLSDAGDSGCALAVAGSGDTYTVTASACAQTGTLQPRLALGAASDVAGNAGPPAAVDGEAITLDRVAPGAQIAAPASPTRAASPVFTVSFTEPVSGIDAGDFAVGGAATGCVIGDPSATSGSSVTVALSGCSEGSVTLDMTPETITDAAGNAGPLVGAANSAGTLTIDRTPPAATVTAPGSMVQGASADFTVAFDEAVSGIATEDFTTAGTATGCAIGVPSAASGTSVTVPVTCADLGTVTLTLAAGSVSDDALNAGPASATSSGAVTVVPPAPSSTSVPTVCASPVMGTACAGGAGSWSGDPVEYEYQWQSASEIMGAYAPVANATASTYTPVADDRTRYLRLAVRARNAGGWSTWAYSSSTAAVTYSPWSQAAYFYGNAASNEAVNDVEVFRDGATAFAGNTDVSMTVNGASITSVGGTDAYVAKLSPTGTSTLWLARAGGSGADDAVELAALADGSVVVVGTFRTTATFGSHSLTVADATTNTFVAKLDANGTWAWATRFSGSTSVGGVSAYADGSVLVAGGFSNTTSFGTVSKTSSGGQDAYFAKVASDGTVSWVTTAGGTPNQRGYDAAVLQADGSAVVTGTYADGGASTFGSFTLTKSGSMGMGANVFIGKLDASGSYAWVTPGATGSSTTTATPKEIDVFADGSSISTGFWSSSTLTFGATTLPTPASVNDVYVTRVAADGSVSWATRVAGTGNEYPGGIAAGPDGSASLVISFAGTTTAGTHSATSLGDTDVGTARIDSDGTFAWLTRSGSRTIGGSDGDVAKGVRVRADGATFTASDTNDTGTYGATSFANTPIWGPVIAKLNTGGAFVP